MNYFKFVFLFFLCLSLGCSKDDGSANQDVKLVLDLEINGEKLTLEDIPLEETEDSEIYTSSAFVQVSDDFVLYDYTALYSFDYKDVSHSLAIRFRHLIITAEGTLIQPDLVQDVFVKKRVDDFTSLNGNVILDRTDLSISMIKLLENGSTNVFIGFNCDSNTESYFDIEGVKVIADPVLWDGQKVVNLGSDFDMILCDGNEIELAVKGVLSFFFRTEID